MTPLNLNTKQVGSEKVIHVDESKYHTFLEEVQSELGNKAEASIEFHINFDPEEIHNFSNSLKSVTYGTYNALEYALSKSGTTDKVINFKLLLNGKDCIDLCKLEFGKEHDAGDLLQNIKQQLDESLKEVNIKIAEREKRVDKNFEDQLKRFDEAEKFKKPIQKDQKHEEQDLPKTDFDKVLDILNKPKSPEERHQKSRRGGSRNRGRGGSNMVR